MQKFYESRLYSCVSSKTACRSLIFSIVFGWKSRVRVVEWRHFLINQVAMIAWTFLTFQYLLTRQNVLKMSLKVHILQGRRTWAWETCGSRWNLSSETSYRICEDLTAARTQRVVSCYRSFAAVAAWKARSTVVLCVTILLHACDVWSFGVEESGQPERQKRSIVLIPIDVLLWILLDRYMRLSTFIKFVL